MSWKTRLSDQNPHMKNRPKVKTSFDAVCARNPSWTLNLFTDCITYQPCDLTANWLEKNIRLRYPLLRWFTGWFSTQLSITKAGKNQSVIFLSHFISAVKKSLVYIHTTIINRYHPKSFCQYPGILGWLYLVSMKVIFDNFHCFSSC